MRRAHSHVLVAAVLLLMSLVGCGDRGAEEQAVSGEEKEIVAVIEQASTENDPAHCTELYTEAFVEQATFEIGDGAIKTCEKNKASADEESTADSVEVSDVEIEAEEATARTALEGGSSGNTTIVFELVEEGDRWKLDRIDSIPELDTEALLEDITSDIQEGPDIPDDAAQCIVKEFEALSEEELEELVISGDPRKLLELLVPCVRDGQPSGGSPPA